MSILKFIAVVTMPAWYPVVLTFRLLKGMYQDGYYHLFGGKIPDHWKLGDGW